MERSFVAGYLCHLAADEVWKELGWQILQEFNLDSLADLPVPGDVCLTVFDVISNAGFRDFDAIVSALEQSAIPQVFTHAAWEDLCEMWDLVENHIIDRGSAESYFAMLQGIGIEPEELASTKQRHEQFWDDAVDLFESIGGVVRYIEAAVKRSQSVIPILWNEDDADGSL
jgi:hypothetical protein